MDVRLDDGTIVRNVPEGITKAELMRRLGRRMPVNQQEPVVDPLAGMSVGQRALANIGAGMTDLSTGVRSLATDIFGSEESKRAMEQEVVAKRERDRALAASVPGGGALQIAGSVAPTLLIPAAPFVTGASRAAIAGAGGATGAAFGAIAPRGPEEGRGVNIALGGALGAGLPLALGATSSGIARLRGTPAAAQEIVEALTEGLPASQRGQRLSQTIAALQDAQGPVAAVNRGGLQTGTFQQQAGGLVSGRTPASAYAQPSAQAPQALRSDVPLSVAAQVGDPQLARLEAGSRARSGANWYEFDQTQARAIADQFFAATRGAEDIGARKALRAANREKTVAQALSSVNENAFIKGVDDLKNRIANAMTDPAASNPAVRNMLEAVSTEIDRLGPAFSPAHLAEIRANLSGKVPMNPINAYQAAPRESPATIRVLESVDSILNNATNNRWSNVVSGYKRDSDIVRSSQAASQVRERFFDPATGGIRPGVLAADTAGEVPKITEAALGRAMYATRGPRGEIVLDPTVNARLESLLGALRKQGIVQGVKRSATAGGGSNTASDTIAAAAARAGGDIALEAVGGTGGGFLRSIVPGVRNMVNARRDAALARALQDPAEFTNMLQSQLRQQSGLGLDESEVLRVIRALRGRLGE